MHLPYAHFNFWGHLVFLHAILKFGSPRNAKKIKIPHLVKGNCILGHKKNQKKKKKADLMDYFSAVTSLFLWKNLCSRLIILYRKHQIDIHPGIEIWYSKSRWIKSTPHPCRNGYLSSPKWSMRNWLTLLTTRYNCPVSTSPFYVILLGDNTTDEC